MEKRKEKKRGEANRGRKEKKSDRERERGERNKKGDFPGIPTVKLDGPRRKVDPRIESYVWVHKSGSFVKLQEVENFPTWIIFSLKVI